MMVVFSPSVVMQTRTYHTKPYVDGNTSSNNYAGQIHSSQLPCTII